MTVAPMPRPMNRDESMKINGKPVLTAARAVEPTKLPTTMLSTML